MRMAAIGSKEYWRDAANFAEDWHSRSIQAARFVAPGSRVLDLGCGPAMALRNYLPSGCAYTPADLVPWTPEVQWTDADEGIFPPGEFDYVIVLGVIEYLSAPDRVFQFARERSNSMVVSYCHPTEGFDPAHRSGMGWINSFSEKALLELVRGRNWRAVRSELFRQTTATRQTLYELAQSR
jgi:hypothetical protein